MLGTIGFGSLTITKKPDSSSAQLMQLAADNEGLYSTSTRRLVPRYTSVLTHNSLHTAEDSCPPVVYLVLEIPLLRLASGTDKLFITIMPAIITEWHLSLPR
jgi:hypothetical protein